MPSSDQITGGLVLALSISFFAYYTAWVLVLPFVEEGNPVYAYFPSFKFAVAFPTLLLVVVLSIVAGYMGSVFMSESDNRKKK